MKHNLLFIAIATLVLASCQQDKPVNINNGNPIDFRVHLGTRATETTTSTLNKIVVTALSAANENYFTDLEFTKHESFFTSTPVYYWPGDGSTLNFYAYAPTTTDLSATVTIDKDNKKLTDYSPAEEIANQKDFITAHATGSKANEATGVALNFKHQLSQIEIKAKNGNTGYTYKVQGIRIGQPVSKGTFKFTENTWDLGTEKTNYSVTYEGTEKTLNTDAQSLMGESNSAMLIPQQLTAWNAESEKTNTSKGAYLAVKLQIVTKDGARVYPATAAGEYDWAALPIDTKWEAGKKYIYTLDFSEGAGRVDPEKQEPADPKDLFKAGEKILGGPIKFKVTVEEWQDADPQDINV